MEKKIANEKVLERVLLCFCGLDAKTFEKY